MKQVLVSAALAFDNRQANKPGYNRFAMPQYLQRIDEVMADIADGATPHDAIVAGFSGRLAAALLKAIGAAAYTQQDAIGGVFYQQAARP